MKILVDHGDYGNLGDAAMVESVVRRLRFLIPGADLYVINRPELRAHIWDGRHVLPQSQYRVQAFYPHLVSNLPFFWRYNGGWQKITCGLTLMYLKAMGSARKIRLSLPVDGAESLGQFCEPFDALQVVGGGNLTDTFLGEMLRRGSIVLAFAEQNKPVMLTGQQLGPFTSYLTKSALARILPKACFLGLREAGDSLRFCKEAGLDEKAIEVMGDDSLGLPPTDDASTCKLLSKYSVKPGGFLAVNLRLSRYSAEHAAHVEKIAALIVHVARQFQMPVLIVPIALNPSDSDVISGKRLLEAMLGDRGSVIEENGLTPALVKGLIGKAFGAMGSSYHFCTFALSQGVPAICLYDGKYYSQKAWGLCDFWQDNRLGLWLRKVDVDGAVVHCAAVLKDVGLREKLRLLSEEAAERWRVIFDHRARECFSFTSTI
jgi:polysaccharide pyruvyl transferase WcaK-like protein